MPRWSAWVAFAAILAAAGCEIVSLRKPAGAPSARISAFTPLAPQVPDPPLRAIRISYLQRVASFRAAGTSIWARAELNRPLAQGDALWTDVAARAELHLGSAAIRMDARTSLDLMRFDDRAVQAKVPLGTVGVTVRRLAPGEVLEFDTPNGAVTLLRAGQYRIDVDRDMDTTFVTARTGAAEVSCTRIDFTVDAGERVNVFGPDAVEYGLTVARASDQFDEFCQRRDAREAGCISDQFVSADLVGAADLDEFGEWREDPKLGAMWTPRGLPAGWAPFRFGHWTWIAPWGWTWIDDARWGFAPFHYGRWSYVNGAWSWVPGPRDMRSVYAPALAIFVGGGRRGFRYLYWSGRAEVAWFALGPGEAYDPPYLASAQYLANIDGANTARGSHANLAAPGAVTAVPVEAFVRGEFLRNVAKPILAREASLAAVDGTTPPVAPIELSLSPSRSRFVQAPPEASEGTVVVARHTPPSLPLPFRLMQPMLDSHPGRPLDYSEVEALRKTAGEPQRTDIRYARLGAHAREPLTPPYPVRTPEEMKRQQVDDARRLHEIRRELRRSR